MRIYIDTSVVNGLLARDEPRIMKVTADFFQKAALKRDTLYASDLVISEIERTPVRQKREQLLEVLHGFEIEVLPTTDEALDLAKEYIAQKIIPKKYLPDALHIANATVHNIPILVSWNFEHIVKHRTRVEVSKINRTKNFPVIDICSPEEI